MGNVTFQVEGEHSLLGGMPGKASLKIEGTDKGVFVNGHRCIVKLDDSDEKDVLRFSSMKGDPAISFWIIEGENDSKITVKEMYDALEPALMAGQEIFKQGSPATKGRSTDFPPSAGSFVR